MVATTVELHPIQVGAPFYAGRARPEGEPGAPVLHKFDTDDFVPRFLAEVAQAASSGKRPSSMLGAIRPQPVPDFDTDALDFLSQRFRKVYLPVHFRFYLAACELSCLVPGFPGPLASKVKKVELVVRRVGIRKGQAGSKPTVEEREWSWVQVPEPELFPEGPPPAVLQLSSRLTGNTHTWWPIPRGQEALEGERRHPMSRVPGVDGRAMYFAFLPISSGEMYGPRPLPETPDTTPDPGLPPQAPSASEVVPKLPLVAAPSKLALRPASLRSWSSPDWRKVLGVFSNNKVGGPRPKFESPPLEEDAEAGWAYVVRCVATVEHAPGCVLEHWGPPTEPMLVAPYFDPFGGRPTQVELPSLRAIKKMVGNLNAAQLAKRGGLNFGVVSADCLPSVKVTTDDGVKDSSDLDEDDEIEGDGFADMKIGAGKNCKPNNQPPELPELCFWPIFLLTILAYLMINIALAILLFFNISFAFLLKLKFCIGLVRKAAPS